MSLADELARSQEEDDQRRKSRASKFGDYTGERCPNCGRERVMLGSDGKRRCEKCAWCIEDAAYDGELIW
jgi:ribosomal protein L37AE/L43A